MAKVKLQVKNLQVSFRTQAGILKAVRDINFDLYENETLAIVGESGSGKSVTSKAIIGILSGNSIVEGGEILYDGQDLLKIDEEHFHKIRGDKIAMIFQDPLSSLNPIVRVGRQLTEAMILNGKSRQKNSRKEFNSKLALLLKDLNECKPETKERNAELCKTFDDFCIISTHLEKAYNDANAAAVSLKTNIEEIAFLIEKRQKVNVKKQLRSFFKQLGKTQHIFVVHADEVSSYQSKILNFILNMKKGDDPTAVLPLLNEVTTLLSEAVAREHPDFFRLGYYKYVNPDFDEATIDVPMAEFDKMSLDFLNEHFMNEFLQNVGVALQYSRQVAVERKKVLAPRLKDFLKRLQQDNVLAQGSDIKEELVQIIKEVDAAVDYLRITKHSIEYSFAISVRHEVKRYFEGLRTNPRNLARYHRMQAKFDALVAKGKSPTWKVIPPYLVDLELTKSNIEKITSDLITRYEKDINKTDYDVEAETIAFVDFMKEQASKLVYRITKGIAKTRALELLKEVGIPEPAIRFRQYPFEFSGGMRQRIVIAIALSANPDILICDEPTTALDVTIQSQILELINKIKKERNLSVIFITHDLGVVANMADRIAVMYAGKIVEYGTSDDVFYDPRHPYTWALLASMPDLETKEKLEAIPGTPPNMIYPPVGDAFAERNKYAMEIDFEQQPPMFQISDTHYAATWLLHPEAPKVNPPKIIAERIKRMKKEVENYGK